MLTKAKAAQIKLKPLQLKGALPDKNQAATVPSHINKIDRRRKSS